MDFASVESAIEACRHHLAETGREDPQIEAFLAQYLLVLAYSAYENELGKVIDKKAALAADNHIEAFVKSARKNVFRSIRINEITGLLGRFGTELKERFSEAILDTEAHTSWDSIVNNRHDFAHGAAMIHMTFADFCRYYIEGKKVVEEFGRVLGVRSA